MRGLFHPVRLDTFETYDDPRYNVTIVTLEAFTVTLPRLPAGVSTREAYERLMDASTQLAAGEMKRVRDACGPHELHLIPLVSLYGPRLCELDEELRPWLAAADGLPLKQRAVFRLIAHLGWTNARTAKLLGRSEGHTSKVMTRAKGLLTDAGVSVEELQGFFDEEIERRKDKE
ncbi:hypothetical protein [Streptomyces sp. NPDC096132]|uniref:hypothetical protein n=1 Tax=Streptomyces sp. NPDC096132 TaxID=3366075 RepID=UPI0038042904